MRSFAWSRHTRKPSCQRTATDPAASNTLLSPPLCQKSSLQCLALGPQLGATGRDTFRHLALATRIEPVLPVLGHIPSARYGLALHGQRIALRTEGSQLIPLTRPPTLVPQSLVIGFRARCGVAEDRHLAATTAHCASTHPYQPSTRSPTSALATSGCCRNQSATAALSTSVGEPRPHADTTPSVSINGSWPPIPPTARCRDSMISMNPSRKAS